MIRFIGILLILVSPAFVFLAFIVLAIGLALSVALSIAYGIAMGIKETVEQFSGAFCAIASGIRQFIGHDMNSIILMARHNKFPRQLKEDGKWK